MAFEFRFRPLHPGPLDRVSRGCAVHGPVEAAAVEGVVVCCTNCTLSWDRITVAVGAGSMDFGVVSETELTRGAPRSGDVVYWKEPDSVADLAKRVVAADATMTAASNDTTTCPECLRLDSRLAAVYIGEWATWDSAEGEDIVKEWVRHVEEVHRGNASPL